MNLRDLEYLVALAEHRHFGRAAEACFVSQPTLSTQIRKLETELDVDLVERGGREIILTDVGEQIVDRARAVLRETAAIRDIARLSQSPEAGTIRLGVFPTLAPYLLPHVVPVAHRTFPDLELLLVEEKTDELLAQLRRGQLDVVVLATPVDADGLHEAPLFREDFLVAVPADHPLAADDRPVDVAVLRGEHVLLLEDGHCLRDQALSVCRLVGAREDEGFRATSLETLRQMVATGVAITLLPRLAVDAGPGAARTVVARELAQPVPHRDISMFWRDTSPFREFLPRLAEVFRDVPEHLVHRLDPAEANTVAG